MHSGWVLNPVIDLYTCAVLPYLTNQRLVLQSVPPKQAVAIGTLFLSMHALVFLARAHCRLKASVASDIYIEKIDK